MAARKEQLRVELTATDKLSKVVDKAAKAVEDLDGEQAEVEVTADTDKAEEAVEQVDKLVDELDGKTAEATLSAEDQAKAEIDEVMRRLQDLDDEEVIAVLTAKASKLEAEVKNANSLLSRLDGEDATAIITAKDHASAQLKAVNSRLDDLQGGFKNVTTSGTQSRSVLANLAGNSAQDLGELGGVVGSLGVGVGQLAEYAVDGNIKMKELAKVAGPMAGLAATMFLIQSAMATLAKKDAWRKEQVESYAKAVEEVGVGVGAIERHLREIDDLSFFDEGGITDWFMGGDSSIPSVAADLGLYGFTVRQVTGYIAAGEEGVQAFDAALEAANVPASVQGDLLKWMREQQEAYTTATAGAAAESAFFATTQESANEALAAAQDPMSKMPELWDALIQDAKDGSFEWENAAGALDQLAEATGQSTDEIIRMIEQEVDKELEADAEAAAKLGDGVNALAGELTSVESATGRYASALGDAVAAANEHADAIRDEEIAALEAEQEALEDTVDALEGYIDAQRDAYDTQIDYREATEDAEDALAEYKNALTETDDETGELIATQEEINDLGEDFVQSVLDQSDALVEQNRAQAAANGAIYSGTQAIEDQNRALLNSASAIPNELLPQYAAMIAAINGIPEEKETILTMLRQGVDPAVILDYLNGISGTHQAAVEVEANQAAINNVANQLAYLTRDRYVKINTYGGLPGQSAKRASGGPVAAGHAYTVGEQGEELFVPDQDGTIVNASDTAALFAASEAGRHLMPGAGFGGASAGGGDAYYDVTVNMPPGSNGQDVLRALQQLQRQSGPLPLRVAAVG